MRVNDDVAQMALADALIVAGPDVSEVSASINTTM